MCFTGRNFSEKYEVGVKVLLVPSSGYLCHRDIFYSRMTNFAHAESIVSFTTPDDSFLTAAALDDSSLLSALSSSPGALIAARSTLSTTDTLDELECSFRKRFSFDWTVAKARPLRKVAVVAGCPMFGVETGSFGSRGPLEAVETLGLSMTVLDSPGHWLAGDAYSHLRHDFISIDLTINSELPYRIASSLRSRDIDGIVTFSPGLIVATAKAAHMLNLPSESLRALLRTHKHEDTAARPSGYKSQTVQLYYTQPEPGFLPDVSWTYCENHDCWMSGSKHALTTCDRSGRTCHLDASRNILPCIAGLDVPITDFQEIELVCLLWKRDLLSCGTSEVLSKRCFVTAHHSSSDSEHAAECFETVSSGRHEQLTGKTRELVCKHLLELGFHSGVFCIRARALHPSFYLEPQSSQFHFGYAATSEPRLDIFAVEAQPPHLHCAFPSLDTHAVTFCALHILRCLGDFQRFIAFSDLL